MKKHLNLQRKTFNFKVQFEECNAETTNIKCGLAVIFKEFISEGWHVLALVKKKGSQAIENNQGIMTCLV